MHLKRLFKQAYQITWQNPYLWLLGFFAALFASNEISSIIFNSRRVNNWINNLVTFKIFQSQFHEIFDTLGTFSPVNPRAVFNLTLSILVFILFLWIAFLSQIALIRTAKHFKNKKLPMLGDLFSKSQTFLWPVIIINVVALLIIYGLLSLLGLPLLTRVAIPIIVYIIIFVLAGIFISFVTRFILCFIILEKEKFLTAIKKGILFFFKNWWITVKTSVALFLIGILVGLGLFLVGIGTSAPFLALIVFFARLNLVLGFWLVLILWTIILGTVILLLGSAFSSFQFLTWALLFLNLRKKVDKL